MVTLNSTDTCISTFLFYYIFIIEKLFFFFNIFII